MRIFALVLCFLLFFTTGDAQTAQQIIQQHIQAIGGLNNINSEQTIRATGTFESAMMGTGQIETISINKKGFRMNITKGDTTRSTIMYDFYRWSEVQPGKKNKAVRLPEAAWNSLDLELSGEIVEYEKKGHTAAYIGKEAIDGKNCYKIRLTHSSGKVTDYFIDTENYYILQSTVVQMKDGKEIDAGTSRFGDYRKVENGTVKPFLLMQVMNGKIMMTTRQTLIEINKPVDMKLFEKPTE